MVTIICAGKTDKVRTCIQQWDAIIWKMAGAGAITRLKDVHLDRILLHLDDAANDTRSSRIQDVSTQSSTLAPITNRDVASFRLANQRFNKIYLRHFRRVSPAGRNILELPSEIHDIILDYLVSYDTAGQLIPIAKKSSLSVESFTLLVPQQTDTKSIANYVCAMLVWAKRRLIVV